MLPEIKQRIEQIQRGEVPEGYRRTKDIGLAPKEWRVGRLSDVLHNEQRPVPKPDEPYWRLGVKSWAKGTFHAFVDDPSTVDMDELYVVKEKDLIVNITFAWEHAIAIAKKEDDGLLVSHRFPTYMFDDGNVPDFYQAVFGQHFFKGLLDNISPGGAGRNRVLNRKDFLNLPCYIPPIEEQRKIAEILATCDRVIQLKQKLLDELKKLKKVCLEKMFPQKGNSVPEIRFPGFTAPWEQRKFSEFAQREAAFQLSSAEYPSVEYEDVVAGEGRLNKDVRLKEAQKTGIAFDGTQVLYGKLRPYLHNWLNPDFSGVAVGDWWVLRPVGVNKEFLYRLIQTQQFDDIANLSSGSKMPRADWNLVSNTDFIIPSSLDEQRQIAETFDDLDTLITLHQRELEAEQQKKKALMKLLLTGIVRTV